MQGRKNRSQLQWFDQYKASKTALFWACAGSVVVATVVGFTWGGWTTGGSAQDMADKAAARRARNWPRSCASTASWPRRTRASS